MRDQVRIHVVDDDADTAASLSDLLSMRFPQAQVVTDGTPTAALQRLAGWRPDLVLSDYRMPEMDGIAFLRRVHDLHPGVPLVLLTASAEQETAADAARSGVVNGWFQKPVDIERLIDGLRQLLP